MKKNKEPNTYSVKPTFDNNLEKNMKTITALTLGLVIGLSAISTTSFAASKKLTGAEIKQALAGKSFKVKGSSWRGTISYTGSTYSGKNTKNGKSFKGVWRVKGDKQCGRTTELGGKPFKEREKCATIKSVGNGQLKRKSQTYTPL